jgi:hypothetical protein
MINKLTAMIIAINFAFIASYQLESAFAQTNNVTNATQGSKLTDQQKFNNGYNAGLKNSQKNFKSNNCNPEVPTDVVHTIPFQKGYALGYSKGPCGGKPTSSTSNSSSSAVPGILR